MTGATGPRIPPAAGAPPAATPAIVLRSSEFRRGREASWLALEDILVRVEKRGLRGLAAEDLEQLPLLYRALLSSLSVARSIALDRNMLLYLESLAVRGFIAVYGPRRGLIAGVGAFLRHEFPAAVRAARWHILITAIALVAGAAAGFALTMGDEAWFSALVPGGLASGRGPASTRAELMEHEIFAPWPGAAASFAVMANALFTHNTTVGILAFSLGLAAGVPTLMLLAYQGLILGAFLALHANRGLTVDFLGWVSIHGVTELTAIVLCGGAGLVIAEKLLFPGPHSRLDSLALHGRVAAQVAVGAVLMFFVAAIIEGGFRQLVQSTELRFAVAALTALVWLAYFIAAARRKA
jgi:uncharacterized membrane protein SpoIIM required for sporulation